MQAIAYGANSVGLFVLDGILLECMNNLSGNDSKNSTMLHLLIQGAVVTIVNGALGVVGLYDGSK